jgi:hypothetical protein
MDIQGELANEGRPACGHDNACPTAPRDDRSSETLIRPIPDRSFFRHDLVTPLHDGNRFACQQRFIHFEPVIGNQPEIRRNTFTRFQPDNISRHDAICEDVPGFAVAKNGSPDFSFLSAWLLFSALSS